uniref:Uncharacterized protein n=1 Tax=Panagrolaimus davidi TaxID=227884 RepID=A0A914Q258_9BILA
MKITITCLFILMAFAVLFASNIVLARNDNVRTPACDNFCRTDGVEDCCRSQDPVRFMGGRCRFFQAFCSEA